MKEPKSIKECAAILKDLLQWKECFVKETMDAFKAKDETIAELKETIEKLQETIEKLQETTEKLQETTEKLQPKKGLGNTVMSYADIAKVNANDNAKVIKIVEEKLQRDCNLIFHGIEESYKEDIEKKISPIIDSLEVETSTEKILLKDLRRLGSKKDTTEKKPRPIRVTVQNRESRDAIVLKARELSWNGYGYGNIYVTIDRSVEERKKLKTLIEEAKRRNEDQAEELAKQYDRWQVVGKINPYLRKVSTI